MRHLWSLLAGVVAAPLAWLFLATGQHRSQRVVEIWDQSGRYDTVDLIGPVAFLTVAGILLGLLGTLRWSPAGPLVAGLLFLLPTVLMFNNPFDTLDRFLRTADGAPRRFLGQDLEPWLPVQNGTLLVLGALLLMAVFSTQRWRRWPAPVAVAAPAGAVLDRSPADRSAPAETGATAETGGTAPAAPDGDEGATERRPLTDDEILAAAAAYEAADTGQRPSTSAVGEGGTMPRGEQPRAEPGEPEPGGRDPDRPEPSSPGPDGPERDGSDREDSAPAPDRGERTT